MECVLYVYVLHTCAANVCAYACGEMFVRRDVCAYVLYMRRGIITNHTGISNSGPVSVQKNTAKQALSSILRTEDLGACVNVHLYF